ncbi:LysR family transcriptional regulator [Kineosporia succinea]|uniref:DNA-binding transcriptional LysR family regulator n=1 Tax=Kineosporia succinea TaxID=84632 RepID=A0ABT9PFK5_9ACTN|nr:LysR family transcriptional regulator [Kineosporia succinea]MDP9830955.1 DNA-binding transcriptional LysR family regulator [Kineosporia succinea]
MLERLEIRQLRHFSALAKTRSITAAARSQGIVQSGLSNSIQMLERELGAELYVRGTRPLRLTAAGEALVGPARQAIEAVGAARRAVLDTQEVLSGRLRLGLTRCAQHMLPLARHLGDFLAAHPGIDVRVCSAAEARLIRMVEAGELDCAVAALPEKAGRLRMFPIVTEQLTLTCGPGHPLANALEVSLDDLAGQHFVEVPATWASRKLIDETFRDAGLERRVLAEVDDWTLILDLLATGTGLGFVPSRLPARIGNGRTPGVRQIPVSNLHLSTGVGVILPAYSETAPVASAFARDLGVRDDHGTPGARANG